MATTTTRLGLTKPATSDSMATGATDLSANYDQLDSACGSRTYTSGTRPSGANLWQGRTIFESDTDNDMFYNGSAWKYWGNRINSRELAGTTDATGTNIAVSTESLHASLTFTATQNRRYRIIYSGYLEHSSLNVSDTVDNRIRWAAGSSVTTAGTLLLTNQVRVNSLLFTGRSVMDAFDFSYTGSTQEITVGWFVFNNSATSTLNADVQTDNIGCEGTLIIHDWGNV